MDSGWSAECYSRAKIWHFKINIWYFKINKQNWEAPGELSLVSEDVTAFFPHPGIIWSVENIPRKMFSPHGLSRIKWFGFTVSAGYWGNVHFGGFLGAFTKKKRKFLWFVAVIWATFKGCFEKEMLNKWTRNFSPSHARCRSCTGKQGICCAVQTRTMELLSGAGISLKWRSIPGFGVLGRRAVCPHGETPSGGTQLGLSNAANTDFSHYSAHFQRNFSTSPAQEWHFTASHGFLSTALPWFKGKLGFGVKHNMIYVGWKHFSVGIFQFSCSELLLSSWKPNR